jgi:glycosyltransferase involved in cell wall biosynthesis
VDNLAARVVERSGGGIVVEPGDKSAFLAAAGRLLANEELRAELGTRGRVYAETTFDIDSIARRFEDVIERAREVNR